MTAITLTRSMNDNLTRVDIGGVTLWFSYETIVAYELPEQSRVVSENEWSNTTNRHLNSIDGGSKIAKARRVPHDTFTEQLNAVLAALLPKEDDRG